LQAAQVAAELPVRQRQMVLFMPVEQVQPGKDMPVALDILEVGM
jgi:hypothetical protein